MRKHKVNLLLGILFISFSVQLNAQKPAFETGRHIPPEEAKRKKNNYSWLVASTDVEFLVGDRTKTGQVYTSYSTATLKKQETFTLDYPKVDGKDANWVNRIFRSDETTSIYGYYNRKDDENTVYGKITDRNGKNTTKEKVLAKISASKKKYIGNLGIILSKDESKILIYRELTEKESVQEEIELWLYDDGLNKIYKKKMSFPYKNKQFHVQEYLVTNAGKVIIIAYYSPSKDEIKGNPDKKNQLNFKIFGLTEDKEELEEIKISKKGSALSSAYGWVLDSGTNIAFTGYFREGGEKKYQYGINGIYYVKVNTGNWEIESSHFSKIPKEDLTKIFEANAHSERVKTKVKKAVDNGAGISNFVLKGIYYTDSGQIKIISQVEYYVEHCYTDRNGFTTCYYIYYNNQIVEFDLDQDGNIERTIVIPKQQIGGSTIFFGHIALLNETRTYFIFNDADANFDQKKLEKRNGDKFYYAFAGRGKARLVYAYAKKNGDVMKTSLIDDYKNNLLIYPGACIRVDMGSVITWGKLNKGKELLLVKFYLKEKVKKE